MLSSSPKYFDATAAPVFSRPTWLEIDLAALRSNARTLLSLPNTQSILGVLKADAYGHGASLVARTLCEPEFRGDNRVRMLGVASVDEGRALREIGIEAPILLLSAILAQEADGVVESALTPTVFTHEVALALNHAAAEKNVTLPIQVKIDTGMHRLGVPCSGAAAFCEALNRLEHLQITGIYTHFACADADDATFTREQLRHFETARRACKLKNAADSPPILHAANSAAHLRFPETRYDMARPGIALYGLWPSSIVRAHAEREAAANQTTIELKPVMSFRARVTHRQAIARGEAVSYGATWRASRPSVIAVIAAGYADGYPRIASGRAKVLLRGWEAPVVGRITMDQIMVDVSDIETAAQAPIATGEIVTLWGRDGARSISLDDVAQWAQTISYEIATGVAARVPRIPIEH